jgi:hypothetical protein
VKSWIRALVAIAVLASPARASFETLIPIVQPVSSDAGPEPAVTTYSVYIGNEPAADKRMELTVAPNAIISSSGKPVERNQASSRGIRLACAVAGDTLRVHVDLSHLKFVRGGLQPQDWERPIVKAEVALTLWCGLRNARGAWPSVRFVRYDIPGHTDFARYSGIYKLERVRACIEPRTWNPEAFGPDEDAHPSRR